MNTHPDSENNPQDEAGEEFDLVAPIGDIDDSQVQERAASPAPPQSALPVPPPVGALEDKKSMTWKGFEEEEEDEDPPVAMKMNSDASNEEMDMTPMVDVTFLLLIFFMVTASFTVIRSIQQPKPSTDQPSTVVEEQPEDQDDYVEIIIDQFNTYHITVRGEEEREAGSDLEMQRIVRQAVDDYQPERLVIIAHEESVLRKMIACYSAARIFGIDSIEMQTTDKDY